MGCDAHRVDACIRRVRRRCKLPLVTKRRTSSAVNERSMPVAATMSVWLRPLFGNCLQNRELTGRKVRIPHIAGEQAVRAFAGTMQEMKG
jgi:hypothetical protein